MPVDRLEEARFERVSETGELIFAAGGRSFTVKVDDALERAILEAKQVKSETQDSPRPHQQSTLPISQIQSLIRAGADPKRVAERYDLNEALVRRFSSAVQTEKQYAIEQFLAVPAPKDSKARTVEELVARTLASVSLGMEAVTWKATRRGLEPWHITAQFNSSGRQVRAEWTWNMHDNTVVCLNGAARKLLGEQTPGSASASSSQQVIPDNLPVSASVRSARIERTVSAWAAADPITTTGSMPPIDVSMISPKTDSDDHTDSSTGADATSNAGPLASEPSSTVPAGDAAQVSAGPTFAEQNTSSPKSFASTQTNTAEDPASPRQEAPVNRAKATTEPAQQSKRRSGRSAVPSWDEILFGD